MRFAAAIAFAFFALEGIAQEVADSTESLRAFEKLKVPVYFENGVLQVQPLGIARSLVRPTHFKEELLNRQQQFFTLMARHSAPLRGVDWSDEYEVQSPLAIDLEPLAPHAPSWKLLQAYSLTDYGARMVRTILEDSDCTIKQGFLSGEGHITEKGKEAIKLGKWAGHFIIGRSEFLLAAGRNSLRMPWEVPASFFPVGGEPVDAMALIHHEMGHTRFGMNEVKMQHLEGSGLERSNFSIKQLSLERIAVNEYENPVRTVNRLFYKLGDYRPRRIYFDGFNTLHVPSGFVYQGPVLIGAQTLVATAHPYYYQLINGQVRVNRDQNGRGLVDYTKQARILALISPFFL